MPREDHDQIIDADGNVVEEVVVMRPVRTVTPEDLATAKANLKNYFTTFTQGGVPTGTPTANQNRNAILSLIVAARWLYGEMDNE